MYTASICKMVKKKKKVKVSSSVWCLTIAYSNVKDWIYSIVELLVHGIWYLFDNCFSGAHYKSTPNFSALAPSLQELVVRSIAINSGYTSRVSVSTGCGG